MVPDVRRRVAAWAGVEGHCVFGDLGGIPRTQAGKETGQRGFPLIHSSLKLQEIHTQKKGPKN